MERRRGRLCERLGSGGEIDAAADAVEGEIVPDTGVALPDDVFPGEAGAGGVDLEHGRGAGGGIVAEACVIEPDGIRDAAIHGADGKLKTIAPCLESEGLPHGKKEGRRINDQAQKSEEDEEGDEQAVALPAARADGVLGWRIG